MTTAAILEHALLDVRPGQEDAFLAAFAEARPLIEGQKGFVDLRLERCVEHPSRFLLLVRWDTLEDHTEGFRGSPEYVRWRELLHHFYDPFPEVTHFARVV
ncbi:antibiotic biosynthesis monooxygenase family protein [Streptodolium elevatio]